MIFGSNIYDSHCFKSPKDGGETEANTQIEPFKPLSRWGEVEQLEEDGLQKGPQPSVGQKTSE